MRRQGVMRVRPELQSIDHLDLTTNRVRQNFVDRIARKGAMAAS